MHVDEISCWSDLNLTYNMCLISKSIFYLLPLFAPPIFYSTPKIINRAFLSNIHFMCLD